MKEELAIIKEHKVWHLVKLPENANILGCRWIFTAQHNEKDEVVSFKARLVAQRFTLIKGETYDDTFSPVVNFGLVRFFFSLMVS